MWTLLCSWVETVLMAVLPAYGMHREIRRADGGGGGRRFGDTVCTEAQRRFMVHWIVYAAFLMADWSLQQLFPLPGYGTARTAAVLWLWCGGGTDTVYRTAVGPFLDRNERNADYMFATKRSLDDILEREFATVRGGDGHGDGLGDGGRDDEEPRSAEDEEENDSDDEGPEQEEEEEESNDDSIYSVEEEEEVESEDSQGC